MVAVIILRQQARGVLGIASNFVEVDNAIKIMAGTQKAVYILSYLLAIGTEVSGPFVGENGSDNKSEALSVRAMRKGYIGIQELLFRDGV